MPAARLTRKERDLPDAGRRPSHRRDEMLRILRANPDSMSILAIADALALHPNTVRFHLDRLVGDELVELVEPRRGGPGRPPQMFRAVRKMDRGGTRRYELLADILTTAVASAPDPGRAALAAGRAWGLQYGKPRNAVLEAAESAAAVHRLVDALDELNFAPEHRDAVHQVGMRHCPFLELAENQTDLICQLHLGLVKGILEAGGAAITAERLDALVEPDLCVLHLKPT